MQTRQNDLLPTTPRSGAPAISLATGHQARHEWLRIHDRMFEDARVVEIVASVCRIPLDLSARGDVSVSGLIAESGYLSEPAALTPDLLAEYLARYPGLVDSWLDYSCDKRVSSGWYLNRDSGGNFIVGYYPGGERLAFADPCRACAEFIAREIRAVAEHEP